MTGGFKLWRDKEPSFQEPTSTGSKTVFVEVFYLFNKSDLEGESDRNMKLDPTAKVLVGKNGDLKLFDLLFRGSTHRSPSDRRPVQSQR